MNDSSKSEKTTTAKAPAAKLQHVVVHVAADYEEVGGVPLFDDVIVHGQELHALRSILGKPDWRYVAVAHGQSVAEALKAAGS